MDSPEYSTIMEALTTITDPRKARGKRHGWVTLLTIIVAALASNYQTPRAIAQWAHEQADALRTALPQLRRIPSESTIRRTIHALSATELETLLARVQLPIPSPAQDAPCIITPHGERLQGQALDGKTVRTASAHGQRTHLVSLVQHGSARTIAQVQTASKQAEVTASQTLLRQCDLTSTVTTMDAGLTHRGLAQQIREQGGHYLMMVKKNHPQMYAEIATFFELEGIVADQEQFDRVQTVSKGHGRLEIRTLECLSGSCADWRWPDASQVIRRTCERIILKSGKRTVEVSYGLSCLSAEEAGAAALEQLWRGHWTIENRKHYVRDVTLGEDRHPMYTGEAPQVLAALRNALIDGWRARGWTNIADALRHMALSVQRALSFIGAIPSATLT